MASLRPEDLNVSAVPRSRLGHLKTDAVRDLLQRAAWDYREAVAQNQRLAATVEELTQRVDELTAQVASLEEDAARHKNPDELAKAVLATVQRTAREERESARKECELMLKKAARRAERLEEEVARRTESRLSELTRVETLREEATGRLRATLEEIVGRHGLDPNAVGPATTNAAETDLPGDLRQALDRDPATGGEGG